MPNPFEIPPPPEYPTVSLSDFILQQSQSLKPTKRTSTKESFIDKKVSRLFMHSLQEGMIGLEIEAEGTHLFNTPFKYWSCKSDGSLRHIIEEGVEHPPVEYVLKSPLNRDEVFKALKYLEAKLQASNSSIVMSSRTSVHVHVNCQEMTVRELYKFICLYMIFEEILVDWSGPERAGNLFCLRAKDSDYYIKMLEDSLRNKNFKLWNENVRYAACNVASISKFGSLEFRSLRGTVDVDLIMTWIDILLLIKSKAEEFENPVEIVEKFNEVGPLPFFRQIFSDTKLRNLFKDIPLLSNKLWDGLRMVRDVAYATDWPPPKKKEDQEPEEESLNPLRFKAGQIIDTEYGEREVFWREAGTWTVTDSIYSNDLYHYTVPTGCVSYFIKNRNNENDWWILLDTREGPVEYV